MAGYCKGKQKEMELGEGMGIEVSSTKDKKKKAKNTKGGKKPEEGSDSPPELIEEKSDKWLCLGAILQVHKGKTNEDSADSMKELHREISQWQKRNQLDEGSNKWWHTYLAMSKMRDEEPNDWWRKVISTAMKEVENEMVEESCGAASSNVEVVSSSEDVEEVVEVVKANEESGGATSSKCYYKV